MSDTPKKSKPLKKILILAAKLLVAAALLVWVFSKVDWPRFFSVLKGADIPLLVAALGLFVLSLAVIAVRLQFLLRTQEIFISLWELMRLTFVGQFYNMALPGVVSGDLVKAYYAAKHTDRKGAVMVTVFVDRLMGLIELALLAGAMLMVVWVLTKGQPTNLVRPGIAAIVAMAGVALMLVFILSRRFRSLFHLQKIYNRLPIAHHIESASAAAHRFRNRIGDLLIAIAITLIAHGLWIVGIVLVGRSLSLAVPWYNYFLFIPLIYIIGAVPVTPGAVGVVENCYLLFFMSAFVTESEVIALAVVVRALDIARGLPGAIVAITGAKVPKAQVLESELGMATAEDNPQAAPPAESQS